MRVLFTSKMDGEISSFHPYSFQEVVLLTAEMDTKLKKKNAKFKQKSIVNNKEEMIKN